MQKSVFPVLNVHEHFDTENRILTAKEYIKKIMDSVTDNEKDYLDQFISGRYCPELLFENEDILERIRNHPMALWRCKN